MQNIIILIHKPTYIVGHSACIVSQPVTKIISMKSLLSRLSTEHSPNTQDYFEINESKWSWTYVTPCNMLFWLENHEGREHLKDIGIDVRILLKCILTKRDIRVWEFD
jgi:hypothetical protein